MKKASHWLSAHDTLSVGFHVWGQVLELNKIGKVGLLFDSLHKGHSLNCYTYCVHVFMGVPVVSWSPRTACRRSTVRTLGLRLGSSVLVTLVVDFHTTELHENRVKPLVPFRGEVSSMNCVNTLLN